MSTWRSAAPFALSLLVFGARSASGDDPLSGEGLLALCSMPGSTQQDAQGLAPAELFGDECLAVMRDGRQMMRAMKDSGNCFADIPVGAGEADLARAAVAYFTSHPALMPKAASYSLFKALAAHYPCAG